MNRSPDKPEMVSAGETGAMRVDREDIQGMKNAELASVGCDGADSPTQSSKMSLQIKRQTKYSRSMKRSADINEYS